MPTKKPENEAQIADERGGQPERFQYKETLKLAAYAATGGRKTLQIGHLIEAFGAENVGIISCEHGLNTIKSLVDDRYVFRADTRADMRGAWAWAKEHEFTTPNKWLCVDGGTRALNWIQQEIFGGAQAALEQIINGVSKRDLPANLRPFGSYIIKDSELNGQQMWWQTGEQCDRMLDSFIKLGCNMYWTFWERLTSIDQYTKGPPMKADTPGTGAFSAVKETFDFIFRLVAEGETATAHFRNPPGNNSNYGKVRDDWRGGIKVPDSIPDFNLASFVQLVQGKRTTGASVQPTTDN